MTFTTELVAEDRIRVSTKDPEVVEQLKADAGAQVVAETDGVTKFELPRAAFALHFPA